MHWSGYYINLDRSPGRRAAIEDQLRQAGLSGRYRRYPAVDGRGLEPIASLSSAEVGIYRSHLELLRIAAEGNGLTHIIEDDVRLARQFGAFVDSVARHGLHADLDVIVTDTGFPIDLGLYESFRQLASDGPLPLRQRPVQIIDISASYCWGMTSYIVSPAGARRILLEAEAEWNRGPRLPVDRMLERAAARGRIRVGCSFPLMSWLDMENASVSLAERADESPLVQLVQRLARYPFFADADVRRFLVPALRQLIAGATSAGEDKLRPRGQQALRAARRLLQDCGGAGESHHGEIAAWRS